VPCMLHAKHMESCDQLLETYHKEIMDVFHQVGSERLSSEPIAYLLLI